MESISYYQLAKIYVLKGEKDKAINFLNKAIELDSKLLEVASKEKLFEKIKEYITVSVKMEEDSQNELNEEKEEEKNNILREQEVLARKYLEQTTSLIEQMSENTSKQKLEETLDRIFNKEVNKSKEFTEQIKNEEKETEKIKEQDRQKQHGNN